MLEQVWGLEISDTDFTDDRLAIILRQSFQDPTWQAIEQSLTRNPLRIYALPTQQVCLDTSTISGHHLMDEAGLSPENYSGLVENFSR